MYVQRVVDPVMEPLTLADATAHLRITIPDDNALITGYITAARNVCEGFMRRAMITQGLVVSWDGIELLPYIMPYASVRSGWPGQFPFPTLRSGMPTVLTLPYAPLQAVTNVISYSMTANTPTAYPAANYYVDTITEPGRVALVNGAVWPTDLREIDALRIYYSVGYATPFSVASNVLTFYGRPPVLGESFMLSGTIPAGLSANTLYFVVNVNGQTCQLSLTSSGAAITGITDSSPPTYALAGIVPQDLINGMKAMVADLYENRGDESDVVTRPPSNLMVAEYVKIPKAVQSMLGRRKILRIA